MQARFFHRRDRQRASAFVRHLAIACVILGAHHAAAQTGPVPARFAALTHALDAWSAEGQFPGALALVARGDEILFFRAAGHADLARRVPLRRDAIFRIYSMSKPIASLALLILVNEGRIGLDDPVARHLPEFAEPKVIADDGTTRRAPTPLRVRDLLTHTSGLAFDEAAHPAASRALAAVDRDGAALLEDVAARLARVPLADPPGTHFHYEGANTELVARLVEVASGEEFAAFLHARIFMPLGMKDTGFVVPEPSRGRVVELVTSDANGALVIAQGAGTKEPGAALKPYPSAAGGLYSTLDDYLAFARVLLADGGRGHPRLVSENLRRAMLRDQLQGIARVGGEGFGFGGHVVVDAEAFGVAASEGQFGWSGAASTFFFVDPKSNIAAILLMQYLPAGPRRPASPKKAFTALVTEAMQ